MELVAEYIRIDEPRRRYIQIPGIAIQPEWEAFHHSTAKKISVLAGRGTGKTFNLALRAVRSRHDCLVFAGASHHIKLLAESISHLSKDLTVIQRRVDRSGFLFTYSSGKTIRGELLLNRSIVGRRVTDMEVMFDEFDYMNINEVIPGLMPVMHEAPHVVCVGSIHKEGDSPGKRWFKESDDKFYIDARGILPEDIYNRKEWFPSEHRLVIERLPSFYSGI